MRLTSIKEIDAKGQGPGEVSGPALSIEVEVANDSKEMVDLDATVVNLTGADGAPGSTMTGKPADPLSGTLKPKKSATGTYVFAIPDRNRNPVTVEVSVAPDEPSVLFKGTP